MDSESSDSDLDRTPRLRPHRPDQDLSSRPVQDRTQRTLRCHRHRSSTLSSTRLSQHPFSLRQLLCYTHILLLLKWSLLCTTNHQSHHQSDNSLIEPSFTITREPAFGVPIFAGMRVILRCKVDVDNLTATAGAHHHHHSSSSGHVKFSTPFWEFDAMQTAQISVNTSSMHQNGAAGFEASHGGHGGVGRGLSSVVLSNMRGDGTLYFDSVGLLDTGWYRCIVNSSTSSSNAQHDLPDSTSTQFHDGQDGGQQSSNRKNQFSSFSYFLRVKCKYRTLVSMKAETDLLLHCLAPDEVDPTTPTSHHSPHHHSGHHGGGGHHHQHHNQFNSAVPPPLLAPGVARPGAKSDCDNSVPGGPGRPYMESVNSSVSGTIGRPLTIQTTFCAKPLPLRVYWIHRHLALTPGLVIGPYRAHDLKPVARYNNYCYSSILELSRVKQEDGGEIHFIISNALGIAQSLIQLNVTVSPGSSGLFSTSSSGTSVTPTISLTSLPVTLLLLLILSQTALTGKLSSVID